MKKKNYLSFCGQLGTSEVTNGETPFNCLTGTIHRLRFRKGFYKGREEEEIINDEQIKTLRI